MNCLKSATRVYSPTGKIDSQCAVIVSAIIEVNRKFLMVERAVGSKRLLSQPQGRPKPGQGIGACAVGRAVAEAGFAFVPAKLVGIYEDRNAAGTLTGIRVAVTGHSPLRTKPEAGQRETSILTNRWMTLEQIEDERADLESPVAHLCLVDFVQGQRFPLDLFRAPAASREKLPATHD